MKGYQWLFALLVVFAVVEVLAYWPFVVMTMALAVALVLILRVGRVR